MSRSQRPVRRLLPVAVAVALGLAGCAQPTVPADSQPAHTATPTPTQSAIPESGLPLGCAKLEDAAFVTSQYRGDTVVRAVDENSTARGFSYRAFQQGGGLRCVWAGSGRTDGGYDLGVELLVVTDAASSYASYVANQAQNVAWVADRFGDHSTSFCYVAQDFVQCYGGVLIGTTWLDFRLTDDHHAMTVDQAYTWGDQQVAPAVAAISGAGADRPAWSPPAGAYDTRGLCDPATASAIAGGPTTVQASAPTAPVGPGEVGTSRAAATQCTWTSSAADANVGIAALTGGAWTLPGMAANLAETPGILGGPAQPVTVARADGAFVADGELAWGAIVSHGSLVEVFRDSSNTGRDDVPLLTRLAAYIDAHS